MTDEQMKALREPFPASVIGKLPKLSCKKCSDSPTRVCGDHKKQKCGVCGNYISTAHIDLDYVGHAAATDRLLQVDPEWTWEPMAVDSTGAPVVVNGGIWIRLTICGVTRPGFGDGKSPKEMIGDAIRNAAMRFGVALDLWAKEDLNASGEEPKADSAADAAPVPQADSDEPASSPEDLFQPPASSGVTVPSDNGLPQDVAVHFGKNAGKKLGELTANSVKWYAENALRPDASAEDRRLKAAAMTLLELDAA